jgi:hypothetical protein
MSRDIYSNRQLIDEATPVISFDDEFLSVLFIFGLLCVLCTAAAFSVDTNNNFFGFAALFFASPFLLTLGILYSKHLSTQKVTDYGLLHLPKEVRVLLLDVPEYEVITNLHVRIAELSVLHQLEAAEASRHARQVIENAEQMRRVASSQRAILNTSILKDDATRLHGAI